MSSRRLDVEEIIKKNPRVNRKDFQAADQLSRQMQDEGLRRKGYNIVAPGAGRRVAIGESDKDDSRAIHLKHR